MKAIHEIIHSVFIIILVLVGLFWVITGVLFSNDILFIKGIVVIILTHLETLRLSKEST